MDEQKEQIERLPNESNEDYTARVAALQGTLPPDETQGPASTSSSAQTIVVEVDFSKSEESTSGTGISVDAGDLDKDARKVTFLEYKEMVQKGLIADRAEGGPVFTKDGEMLKVITE